MTDYCGGGASSARPGFASTVFVAPAAVAALLNNIPTPWAVGFAALLGLLTYELSTFCATDPPAIPEFTMADYLALSAPIPTAARATAAAKLSDLVGAYLWPTLCQCDSVPTPPQGPAPAAPPGLQPTVILPVPVQFGEWYPMLRKDTKVLALGCGTPARPAGYTLESFDDSAWAVGVAPNVAAQTWASGGTSATTNKAYVQNTEISKANSLPGNIEGVAPASPIANNCEQFLVRWRVYIGDVTPSEAKVRLGSISNGNPGWGSGSIYNGGGSNVAPTGSVNMMFMAGRIVPNAWNLFVFDVNPSNTSSVNTWSTEGGIFFGLDFTDSRLNPSLTPCCPPDPLVTSLLEQILGLVTITQRQAAPFSYVYGANHAALSGTGSFAVSGLLGLSVDVTTLPDSYGRSFGTPDELFGVGAVTLGTADGYEIVRRVDHDGALVLPAAAGAFTTVGYTLAPGVVVAIRELVREA